MAPKHAGRIIGSAFIAGLLLATGITWRSWEPVPEPFFGLDHGPGLDYQASAFTLSAIAVDANPMRTSPASRESTALPVSAVLPARRSTGDLHRMAAAFSSFDAEESALRECGPAVLVASEPNASRAGPEGLPLAPTPPASGQSNNSQAFPAPADDDTSAVAPALLDASSPDAWRGLVQRVQYTVPAEQAPTARDDTAGELLGPAPFPADRWSDPDGVNWSESPTHALIQPQDPDLPKRGPLAGWIQESFEEFKPTRSAGAPPHTAPPGGRLLGRLRVAEMLRGKDASSSPQATPHQRPADVRVWPLPLKLTQQLEHLQELVAPAGEGSGQLGAWTADTGLLLKNVLATAGPLDPEANTALVALGETVDTGMRIADATSDPAPASATRRAALAVARRVAVWRAATAMLLGKSEPSPAVGKHAPKASGSGDSVARQRAESEVARLLDALERFESSLSAADAAVASGALDALAAVPLPAAADLVRTVRDHYAAANVRITVHQQLVEKMLPEANVSSGRIEDVVLGRPVRGTRTVEQTTSVRFTPDPDEIRFNLEVHGEVDSHTITASGPVALTSRGASSFTVLKPVKIGADGLLFGEATAVASSRSQLANIQTSFDSVPIMRSLVRNIARNQHDEKLPEANREVIDKIISRACREVDAKAEPQFADMAARIREKVWSPLVRLGLEPTPVALETTPGMATARLRLAGDGQLAAHTPRPRAPAGTLMSLQLHDSAINNALDRLDLAGRRLSLEDLIKLLCERVGMEPTVPEETPEDVTIAFCSGQPLRVAFRDGAVQVRVALDSIDSGRRSWRDIVATVTYRPRILPLQVVLEREGPVQLSGPGHHGRAELALRAIFGKIFPKERPVPLLPETLTANPRLADVRVQQAASTDGWFALSLGLVAPQAAVTAAAVTPPPQPPQNRSKLK